MRPHNTPSTETTDSANWIESHRKAYLDQLVTHGYSAQTKRGYERTVDRFCSQLATRAFGQKEIDGAAIEALQQAVLNEVHEPLRAGTKFRLGRFIDYLVKVGAVCLPVPPAKEFTAMDCLRVDYGSYLRLQRGLSEATIYHCLRFFERFMAFRFGDGLEDLNAITPDDILSFLRQLSTQTRPYRGKTAPSHLRNLFKFLFWSGKTRRDLASSIPRMAQPRAANLPRHLKSDEVQRLIDASHSDDAMGRRNYAMLLLLARLGLRAPEVIAIQLEDIDWRAGEILIRGKGKRHDRMPLPEEVGKAIVGYIQNGRMGDSRALFVSDRGPHQEFKDAQIINYVLNKALEKAGLQQPQKFVGSHLLRHSLAIDLLGRGASLEEISDVLRHRSRATTTIYAKCDLIALRSIAQAWPVEGGVR